MPDPRIQQRTLTPEIPPGSAVKVIGLGGVGSMVARYGGLFLASLGTETRLVLIDGDSFEPSNANRMFFGSQGNKADVVRAELLPYIGHSSTALTAVPEYVSIGNLDRLVHPGDIVMLAVDNHATRKLVSDHCRKLEDVCLISGGNDGVENDRRGTYGNCQVFVRMSGEEITPSLTKYHPEIDKPADHHPEDASCTELLTSVPQILMANLAVASSMLNALLLYASDALHYGELCFDIADGLMRPMAFGKPAYEKLATE